MINAKREPTAEQRFKEVVRTLVKRGEHPAAGAILRRLGRSALQIKNGNLSGRQVRWLRVDLEVSPTRNSPWFEKMGPCKLFCCVPGGRFVGKPNLRCRLGLHYSDAKNHGNIATTREHREYYRTCIRCGYRWVRNDSDFRGVW